MVKSPLGEHSRCESSCRAPGILKGNVLTQQHLATKLVLNTVQNKTDFSRGGVKTRQNRNGEGPLQGEMGLCISSMQL